MSAVKTWMAIATAGAVLLGGCASSPQDDQCYQNLGACLLVGTVQTVAYVGVATLVERHRGGDDHHHGRKGRR